jgi:hypothetical protein
LNGSAHGYKYLQNAKMRPPEVVPFKESLVWEEHALSPVTLPLPFLRDGSWAGGAVNRMHPAWADPRLTAGPWGSLGNRWDDSYINSNIGQ